MELYLIKEKIYCYFKKIWYQHKSGIVMGENITFRSRFFLRAAGGKILIGANCFFNHGFSAYSYGKIEIGDNCIFGENVKIYDHNHVFNIRGKLIKDSGFNIGTVVIGNNCLILKGAIIGDNCVLGASSVISGIIPNGSIVKQNNERLIEDIVYR